MALRPSMLVACQVRCTRAHGADECRGNHTAGAPTDMVREPVAWLQVLAWLGPGIALWPSVLVACQVRGARAQGADVCSGLVLAWLGSGIALRPGVQVACRVRCRVPMGQTRVPGCFFRSFWVQAFGSSGRRSALGKRARPRTCAR